MVACLCIREKSPFPNVTRLSLTSSPCMTSSKKKNKFEAILTTASATVQIPTENSPHPEENNKSSRNIEGGGSRKKRERPLRPSNRRRGRQDQCSEKSVHGASDGIRRSRKTTRTGAPHSAALGGDTKKQKQQITRLPMLTE